MRFERAVFTFLVVTAMTAAGCRERSAAQPRLTVFVAASLRDAVEELAAGFAERTGMEVSVSAAGSGILRKQVESGAGCDVFIAADAVDVDKLAEQGLIVADTRREVARNRLVLMACDDKPRAWSGLEALANPDAGRVALGDPAYVPAGRHAKRALKAAGVWAAIESRAVLADNVRVACQYVRSGQADVGLVYATDVALMPDCRVVSEIDETLSGPIVCTGAVCKTTKNAAASRRLLDFLTAPEQAAVWQHHGFRTAIAGKTEPRP